MENVIKHLNNATRIEAKLNPFKNIKYNQKDYLEYMRNVIAIAKMLQDEEVLVQVKKK